MLFAIVFYNNHKNLSVKCPDKTIYEYENNNLKYKTREFSISPVLSK